MKYEFQDSDGNLIELDYPMREAPSIGSIIEHEGRRLTRVPSLSVQVDPATNRSQYPYVSQALPRNLAGCKTAKGGKPIVESKRHEREIMARHGYVKD
jgi:hypothetical protein